MRHLLIIFLLTACTTWKPNASLTGRVIEVKTIGKSRFEMKLATDTDTVTAYVVRFQKPRIGDRYKVRYDSVCTDQGRRAIIHKLK